MFLLPQKSSEDHLHTSAIKLVKSAFNNIFYIVFSCSYVTRAHVDERIFISSSLNRILALQKVFTTKMSEL
jgi:hypothetical protein